MKASYDIQVQLVHFPLHPDTPLEGQRLEDLFKGRNVDLDAMYTRMAGLMRQEGLEYAKRTHTYNSRLAQELGKWADTQPGGGRIHDALYRAYFVEGRNIGDAAELVRIAQQVGLPPEQAAQVLETRAMRAAVDDDWRRSAQAGVTGVPTFVAAGYGVVGAQPYDVLEQLVQEAGAAPRSG